MSLMLPLTFGINLTPIDCHCFTPLLSAFLQITHQHIHAAHPNPLCQQCLPNQLLTLLHSFVLCIPPNHPAAEPCCTSKSPLPTMPAKAPSDFSFHTFNTPLQTLHLQNSHTHTHTHNKQPISQQPKHHDSTFQHSKATHNTSIMRGILVITFCGHHIL